MPGCSDNGGPTVLKFQEGQEVSMRSMLNLGGLGHAPRKIFKNRCCQIAYGATLCDKVDKLFSVKTYFLLNSFDDSSWGS